MKKLVKIIARFDENKGLSYEAKEFNIIGENEKSLVIDTEDFETIYKYKEGEEKSDYKNYFNIPKVEKYPISVVLEVKGYYETEAKGVELSTKEVDKWIVEKLDYYGNLQILLDNKISNNGLQK